jgi:hypothetical protein
MSKSGTDWFSNGNSQSDTLILPRGRLMPASLALIVEKIGSRYGD